MKKDTNDWSNTGRVDGGNRHAGHIGGGDNRGVGMVGNENRPTARGWDDRNSNQLNNGSVDTNPGMWSKQPPPQQPPQQSQWGGGPPGPGPVAQGHGNMGMGGHGGHSGIKDSIGNKPTGSSGWDDVSPPTQRRPVPNIPNYDDGTSLWGNVPANQQPQQAQQPRGMPPNRGMPNKMDNPMGWGGHGQTRYISFTHSISIQLRLYCVLMNTYNPLIAFQTEMAGKVLMVLQMALETPPVEVVVAGMKTTKTSAHGEIRECPKATLGATNPKLQPIQIPAGEMELTGLLMCPTGVFQRISLR